MRRTVVTSTGGRSFRSKRVLCTNRLTLHSNARSGYSLCNDVWTCANEQRGPLKQNTDPTMGTRLDVEKPAGVVEWSRYFVSDQAPREAMTASKVKSASRSYPTRV